MKLSLFKIFAFFAAIVAGSFFWWFVDTEPVVWQEKERAGTTYFVDGRNKEKAYHNFGVRGGELCFYSEMRRQNNVPSHFNTLIIGCSDNDGDALDPGSSKANDLRNRLKELKVAIAKRRWWQRH